MAPVSHNKSAANVRDDSPGLVHTVVCLPRVWLVAWIGRLQGSVTNP